MSGSPSGSPAPSPAKPAPSGGSAFKNKIAAFESGAAANASKRDQAKQIPHADLSNLRSRFDREGEKPLEVKGSFGLGAAPPNARTGGLNPSRDGTRAVSLGAGRAVSPMYSPSAPVSAAGSSPQTGAGRSASSNTANAAGNVGGNSDGRLPSSSSRPHIPRSDSMGSNSTSATSTSISGATATSTASSLLPGPLAALRAGGNTAPSNSPYGGDDSLSAGLRTPMSSISLSSLHVEAGSVAGDGASSAGDTTANEDEEKILDREDLVTTPHEERLLENIPTLKAGDTESAMPNESIELSAAALERRKDMQTDKLDTVSKTKKASSVLSQDSLDSQQPPQEAVERAAKELDKYTLEKPSTTAVFSPTAEDRATLPTSPSTASLTVPDASEASATPVPGERLPTPPGSTSAPRSPARGSFASYSPKDRLKRSSTANSLASHPESDLADTNLETFDEVDDTGKAKMIGESMVPPLAHGQSSDVPIDTSGPEPEADLASPGGQHSPLDKLLQEEQDFAPIEADASTEEVDEDGMPLVKCSDCGDKVSLVKLADHVCDFAATPAAGKLAFPTSPRSSDDNMKPSFRDRRETGPDDVPKGALSPETVPSPQMSHRSITSSRPDVPDDESLSTASLSRDLDDTHLDEDNGSEVRPESIPSLPLDGEEIEEDYMTALTSHRDSIDTNNTPRPDFNNSNLPESISDPRSLSSGNNVSYYEDDETEELALGMADAPVGTPRTGAFPNGSGQARQMHPDSPTPEQRQILSPVTNTNGSDDQTTPQLNRTSERLATPSNDFPGSTGVRRRSSAGKRNRNLGDTDSEGEIEPGTVTIIR